MSWIAAGGAVISIVGGALSNKSSKKANQASLRAQEQAYARNAQNLQPYMDLGTNSVTNLNNLNSGNFNSFFQDPGYNFAKQQGIGAIDASASSRGNLFGGGTSADLVNFGTGLANQQYGDFYNRQFNNAQMGMNAAGSLAGNNQNMANAQSGYAQNQADNKNQLIGMGTGLASNLINGYLGQRQAGGSRNSSFSGGGGVLNGQMTTGQGSSYNFGNNVGNFAGWGG